MNLTTGPLILLLMGLLFIGLAVQFVRRIRQRRREQFAETPTEIAEASTLESQLTEAPSDEESFAADADAETEKKEPSTEAAPAKAIEPESAEKAAVEAASMPPVQEKTTEAAPSSEDRDGGPVEEVDATAPTTPSETEATEAKEPEALETEPPAVDQALEQGLERTKKGLFGRLGALWGSKGKLEASVFDDLEDAMLMADMGVKLTMRLMDDLRGKHQKGELTDAPSVRQALKQGIMDSMKLEPTTIDPLEGEGKTPRVILFVGVNGVGKTTSIGKIASKLRAREKQVVLAAGDTFRAAAAEQLGIWAERTNSEIIRGESGADPASVVFNAIQHANQKKADIVLADTAGRLHTKDGLMQEIQKVKRSVGKAREGAPDEIWLVVDATTGQNALLQAKEFNEILGLTGVILTKLDGTAKGGVVVAISEALQVPIHFIGVGEQAEDLRPFDARGFVDALFAD